MKMGYTRTSCLFVCCFVCLFVCLFDFCHKNDLNYKLNILGPLCLWQCFDNITSDDGAVGNLELGFRKLFFGF